MDKALKSGIWSAFWAMLFLPFLLTGAASPPQQEAESPSCGDFSKVQSTRDIRIESFQVPFQNFSISYDEGSTKRGHFSVVRKGHLPGGIPVAVKEFRVMNRRIILEELAILQVLSNVSNTVKLIGLMGSESNPVIIYSYHNSNSYSNLSMSDFKWWLRTVLETLSEFHRLGVIHRDLTLSNILADFRNRDLAIIDFGLSTFHIPGKDKIPRVGSIRSKAPELAIEMQNYDCAIDIWSLGIACLDLLLNMRHHWVTPTNSDLIDNIVTVFGSEKWNKFASKFNDEFIVDPEPPGDFFEFAMPGNERLITNETIEFVMRFLTLDPSTRISARQALLLPFFDEPDVPNDL